MPVSVRHLHGANWKALHEAGNRTAPSRALGTHVIGDEYQTTGGLLQDEIEDLVDRFTNGRD